MFEKIKLYFLDRKKIIDRQKELDKLISENRRLCQQAMEKSTPELVLERVMRRGIDWYDYDELSVNDKRIYFNDIQAVITNKAFINELNHLIADQVEFLARESKDWKEVEAIRMTINAVDLIQKRLESISDPTPRGFSVKNIHSAI